MNRVEKIKQEITKSLDSSYPIVLEYFKENESLIREIPKLYFLVDGKRGWNESLGTCYEKNCVRVLGDFYVCTNTLRIFQFNFNWKREFVKSKEDIHWFMHHVFNEEIIDFKQTIEELEKERLQLSHPVVGLRKFNSFFIESIKYGFDISYQEFKAYYNGRPEKEFRISEKRYYEVLEMFRVEVTKKSLSEAYKMEVGEEDTR